MVRISAGVEASYKLDGGFRLLAMRFGVPDGYLPTTAVRLVVLGDGREVYRSPPITSLDEPLAVAVKTGGIKTITIRLESGGVVELGGMGVLMEPALIQ